MKPAEPIEQLEDEASLRFMPPSLRERAKGRLVEMLRPGRLVREAGRRPGRLVGIAGRWALTGPIQAAKDLRESVVPPPDWLASRYGGSRPRGTLALRARHLGRLTGWGLGRGPSPLAPNQEL